MHSPAPSLEGTWARCAATCARSRRMPSEMGKLYRHLARKTIEVARRKGTLEREDGEKLLELLDGYEDPQRDQETP